MRLQAAFSRIPSGIAGFQGKDPIQAQLTIGRKHPESGQPVEKDRFYLMDPRLRQKEFRKRGGGTYKSECRDQNPSFAGFNGLGPGGGQTVIHGNIAHASRDFLNSGYVARILSGGAAGSPIPEGGVYGGHPNKWPVCRGNGERAARWAGGDQATEIPCPGDGCRFRESGDCKVFSELTFRLRWPDGDFPELLTRWSCKSWHSTRNLVGMVEHYESICKAAGISPIYFGLPFTMTLGEKRSAEKKAVFPVVSFAIDGDILSVIDVQQRALSAANRHAVSTAAPSSTPRQLAASLADTYVEDEADEAGGDLPETSAADALHLLREAVKDASRNAKDAKAEAIKIGQAVNERCVDLFGVKPGDCGDASSLIGLRAWVTAGMPDDFKRAKPGSSTAFLAARLRPSAPIAVANNEEDAVGGKDSGNGSDPDDPVDADEVQSYAIAFSDLAGWSRDELGQWCGETFGKELAECVEQNAADLDAKLEELAEGK